MSMAAGRLWHCPSAAIMPMALLLPLPALPPWAVTYISVAGIGSAVAEQLKARSKRPLASLVAVAIAVAAAEAGCPAA